MHQKTFLTHGKLQEIKKHVAQNEQSIKIASKRNLDVMRDSGKKRNALSYLSCQWIM